MESLISNSHTSLRRMGRLVTLANVVAMGRHLVGEVDDLVAEDASDVVVVGFAVPLVAPLTSQIHVHWLDHVRPTSLKANEVAHALL